MYLKYTKLIIQKLLQLAINQKLPIFEKIIITNLLGGIITL